MKQRNIFSTINPESNIWIRNPNHFLKNFDLSGIAVSVDVPTDTVAANLRSGVLISNKHVLFATHVIGDTFNEDQFPKTIKFVNNNNQVFTYTIAYTYYTAIANTDIAIGVLNTVVDPSICYYKVLPSNLETFYGKMIDSCGSGTEMPIVFLDQNKNLSIGDVTYERKNTSPYYNASYIWTVSASYNDLKHQYAQRAISNDSGNAVMAVVNNELVLLGTWWVGAGGLRIPINKGAFIGAINAIHKYYSSINSLMTAMAGTSYSVTPISTNLKTYSGTKIPSIRIGSKYQNIKGYNKAPIILGNTQETSTVYLYDDDYPLGTNTPSSVLNYSLTIPNPYLGITTNYVSGKASIAGNDSLSSDVIVYQAVQIPAPVVNSRSNTTNKRPPISGTWTQSSLTTLNETIEIDIYDNDVKISSFLDIILTDSDTLLSQSWSYTPSSDLSIGSHTIKAKAKSADNGINVSSFSNSISFEIIDSGGS